MKTIIALLFLVISFSIFAQKDSAYYNPNITRKVYALKPLNKINGSYYYGERKLNGFYALEVPFFELNDAEVNHQYKQFKNFTLASQVFSFIPTFYIVGSVTNNRLRQSGYTTNFIVISLASLGGSIACNSIAKSHVKKAAIKYNQAIGKDNLGFWQLKNDDNSLGIALKYNF